MRDLKNKIGLLLGCFVLCLTGTSCHTTTKCTLEPEICYCPEPYLVECLQAPFPKLTTAEMSQEWSRELFLGKSFAKEMDFYRAITCFKRALFLAPRKAFDRRLEIEYDIYLAYYIAGKYQEAVEAYEGSCLNTVAEDFPAYEDLLTTLYDAYWQTCRPERACRAWQTLACYDSERANRLSLSTGITEADFTVMAQTSEGTPYADSICSLMDCYQCGAKSVAKAKMLNAILPGAGYYYVGQKRSAITSFLINALFIAASYQLFDRGYIPAAIITTSLEIGWYFGGINGAGLEAKQYNDCLYSRLGRETMVQERLFPILMIQTGF